MTDSINKEHKKIFQHIDVMSTTKNSITIGWKLRPGNSSLDRKVTLRGYAVEYHAVGSNIKQGVESLGPSLVTYVIKQLHENTIYEICVRAVTTLTSETNEVEAIHDVTYDRRSMLVRGGLLDYPQVVHKRSEEAHSSSDFVSTGNDNDSFPGKAATVHPSIISSSSSSGQNLEFPGAKNLDWYESCIVSSTASSSLSLALGSTLGAFLALGVIVFFVLIAKWQHKNRRQRLKKRWIAGNISASERTQRMTINPELLQMDDLMPCDPCDVGDEPWPSDKHGDKGEQGRDNLVNDIRLNSLDDDLELLNEHRDEIDPQMRRSKEAVDALRRLLQDEHIYAESFVISTPSIKDGSESYNLLVPLSSAQSLLPYLVDNGGEEFPVSTQNRHHYLQHKGASRANDNVRKLKFKKHFTIDYSGCSNDVIQEQARVLDNALQQQVNCSFAAKQSRLFKLQTLKTVDINSSLDTDCDDCQDKLDSDSHENDLTRFEMANDGFDYSNGNDWKQQQQQQNYHMQQQQQHQQQHNCVSDDNDDENNNDETNSGNLCRSFSVEW